MNKACNKLFSCSTLSRNQHIVSGFGKFLQFCFNVVIKDTALEGAKLAIQELPVTARCKECDFQWTLTGPTFTCENCNSGSLEILSGRELDIESIEIAQKDDHVT